MKGFTDVIIAVAEADRPILSVMNIAMIEVAPAVPNCLKNVPT
jgi:hypothetical protein